MTPDEKLMVWRLTVPIPRWGLTGMPIEQSFTFQHKENAEKQKAAYEAAGYRPFLDHLMVNDDHLVPWKVDPIQKPL